MCFSKSTDAHSTWSRTREASRGPVRNVLALAGAALALALSGSVQAATASNAKSPLAMNLLPINYYSAEQPFLNVFKTVGVSKLTPADSWLTHSSTIWDTGEEAYLQLDANGYPTTLTASSADPHSPQVFTSVGVLLLRTLPPANAGTGLPYRAGQYVVLYDGQGTLSYSGGITLVSSSPGRDVFTIPVPNQGGIDFRITSTDPNHTGNYIRNIRVVKAEEESLLNAGNVFEPTFLSLMQNFRLMRFMQWLNIDGNGGLLTDWANRPQATDGGWGSQNGVPIEVAVQLCNALGSDCWLNVPHQANNDYITQMATLVHSSLGVNQKVYIEFSNEVWNSVYTQNAYATAQGKAMWPNAGSGADYNDNWFGMRTAQTCDIWKSTWGADAARVVCVMGSQAANPWIATQSLNCTLWTGNAPCASHGIGAVAIAPYVSFAVPIAWTSASDGGLSQLFEELNQGGLVPGDYPGGTLKWISSLEAAYQTALAPYKLPFISYEGGQGFVAFPASASSPLVTLYTAANRDQRMGAVYTTALNDWKTNGGQIYTPFASIAGPSQYGEWGALESLWDTVTPLSSAPPKWQALQNFISANPCWWSGCVGTIGTATTPTPTAPVLTVK